MPWWITDIITKPHIILAIVPTLKKAQAYGPIKAMDHTYANAELRTVMLPIYGMLPMA
jgi:hypothetical protein